MGDAMGDASRLLLDRYRIEDMLGEGGLGTVYRAFDTLLKRPVAVKTLKSSISADPEIRRSLQERFLREAEAGSRMGSNPNLVTIYDLVADADGTRCLICEFVAGGNLADLIRRGPLPTAAALRLTADAARGLQAAHDVGIVHRDVKPANIFLARDGRAQIGDFGVAQIDDLSGRTHTGSGHPGTPLYMSPEQERMGAYLRPASDQYSLGLVLFEMTTGTIYKRVGEREAASLLDRQPVALAAIVRRMVAEHPDDRFPSMSAVVEAVHQAERQVAVAQTTEPGVPSPSDGTGIHESGLPYRGHHAASMDGTIPHHTPRMMGQPVTPPLSPRVNNPPAHHSVNRSGGVARHRGGLIAVGTFGGVALLIGGLLLSRTLGASGQSSPTPQVVSQSGPATTSPVATLKSGFPSAVAFANPSPTPTITPAPDIVPSATVALIQPVSTATPMPPPTVTPPATRAPEPSPQPSATSRPPAPATASVVTTAAQTFPQQQPTPAASGISPAQVTKAAVTARAQSDMATTTVKQARAAQPVMDYFTAINKHDLRAAFETFDPAHQQLWDSYTFFASEMGKVQHQDYQIISVFSSGTNEYGVHVANPNVDNWLIVTQVKTLRTDGTLDERKVTFEVYDSELKIFSEDLIDTVLQ
jgi:eukaryotic-like serine/threonine-protein kinase